MNSVFGRRGGGRSEGPLGRGSGGGLWLILLLAMVVWLASGFYIVDASQRGVVLRFGKYIETTMPGPRWHLPWPVESVEVVNISEVRTVEVGYRNNVRSKVLNESLMLTDDENIIDLQFAVQYVRSDPESYLFYNREPEAAVMQVAESAIREIVGRNKMDFVLYEGRAQVAADAQTLMQQVLDRYQTGITISKVTMQNAQPPEQVQAAFDDAVKANQDRERQINEGQAYFNDVVPKASGTAARLLQEAEAYRQRVIAAAEGDASRFRQVVGEYRKAPRVTRERLYLDAMQDVLTSATKVIIDQRSNSNLLFLPLDKLMQAMASGAESASRNTLPESLSTPPSGSGELPGGRTRDAFRSRDRESR
jgi:membrane protease subunit HflK